MAKILNAYAPPLIWGAEIIIENHLGSISRSISYEPLGDTLVMGRVKYFKEETGNPAGKYVEVEFKDEITVKTSNSVASIKCDFKGIVLGSAVTVTVS